VILIKYNPINHSNKTGLNIAISLFIGVLVGFILFVAGMMEQKWLLFIVISLLCLSALPIIQNKEKFFIYLFFFSLPIRLDFYPIYFQPTVYRPLNGIKIELYDIIFFFIFIAWMIRLAKNPEEKFHFFPLISFPYLLIWILSFVGIKQSLSPTAIKLSCLWVMFEGWLIFLYVANNLKNRETIYVVVSFILLTLFLQSIIGFGQKFISGHLGLGMFGEGEQSFRQMRAGGIIISRVGGTVGSPNKLALYVGLILPVSLALLFASISRHYKLLLLLPIFIMGSFLEVITFSRGGWLGLGTGLSVTLYWCLARITKRKIVPLILVMSILMTFSITTVALIKPIRERLFGDDYGAAKSRIPMSLVATKVISHNPWLGVGLGNYTSVASRYDQSREAISYVFPWPVHNEFLLIAAELGLPALCLFIFIIVVVFIQLLKIGRSRKDPFISYAAIGFLGGLVAFVIHLQFEFSYIFITMPILAYVGVFQAMSKVIAQDSN